MSNTSNTQSGEREPSYGIEKVSPVEWKYEMVMTGEKRVLNTP